MQREWIVVADGSKAKILKKNGKLLDHVFPTYRKEKVIEDFDKDARKPGHIRQDLGFLGNMFGPHTDIHEHEKIEFLNEIAKLINSNIDAFDKLVLIAPPERLGELRQSLSSKALAKIAREINKDLTKTALTKVYDYVVALPN